MNHSIRRLLTLFLLWLHKVEDSDDIQNVPATVGSGSDVEEKSTDRHVKSESGAQEISSINASELPPHAILGMPALSPTMVGISRWIWIDFVEFSPLLLS